MTKEAMEQGYRIQERIEEIDDVLYAITPYLHNDIEIDIQKKVLEYNGNKLHYRLSSHSPLWLAIGTALKDMRTELQQQFESLDCNSKEPLEEPMEKTTAWWKFWVKKEK